MNFLSWLLGHKLKEEVGMEQGKDEVKQAVDVVQQVESVAVDGADALSMGTGALVADAAQPVSGGSEPEPEPTPEPAADAAPSEDPAPVTVKAELSLNSFNGYAMAVSQIDAVTALENAYAERIKQIRAVITHVGKESEDEVIAFFEQFPISR